MSKMKRCRQCGLLKEEESFRPYTYSRLKGTQGRYGLCRQCEAINTRYRQALGEATPEARKVVEKTELLYARLKAKGLRVPGIKPKDNATQALNYLLDFYAEDVSPTTTVEHSRDTTPPDLLHWLDSSWDEWLENDLTPEYLQETVYESLKAKYRPQTGIDKERLLPIYDDTYKGVLNEILKRFDDYEDFMSAQE